MKVLWISTTGRRSHKEAVRREGAERTRAEAVRRAQVRSAHVAAAVASIPAPRAGFEDIPARRSPID